MLHVDFAYMFFSIGAAKVSTTYIFFSMLTTYFYIPSILVKIDI